MPSGATRSRISFRCQRAHPKSFWHRDWQYIALYGKQSLADDDLGIGLFYKKSDLIVNYEDEVNYGVSLKPNEGQVEYYFCAAWEKEPVGIKDADAFVAYLVQVAATLNNNLEIEIK